MYVNKDVSTLDYVNNTHFKSLLCNHEAEILSYAVQARIIIQVFIWPIGSMRLSIVCLRGCLKALMCSVIMPYLANLFKVV